MTAAAAEKKKLMWCIVRSERSKSFDLPSAAATANSLALGISVRTTTVDASRGYSAAAATAEQ